MNKDIKIMIELQRYWDTILQAKKDIERCEKNIASWEKDLALEEKKLQEILRENRDRKVLIKEKELLLSQLDDRIKKLEERRSQLKTERELEALENELKKIKEEDNDLEGIILELMDKLESGEGDAASCETALRELTDNTEKSLQKLRNDIAAHNNVMAGNRGSFEALLPSLGTAHQSRFSKMLQSKEGKAIGEVQGETCGVCNFQIPSQLAQEASKPDKIVNCTNCGRYIYRQ